MMLEESLPTCDGIKVVDGLARQPSIAREAIPSATPIPPTKPSTYPTTITIKLTSFLQDTANLLWTWQCED
jgi:hypothetical protein